jgi:hypothetical protein
MASSLELFDNGIRVSGVIERKRGEEEEEGDRGGRAREGDTGAEGLS